MSLPEFALLLRGDQVGHVLLADVAQLEIRLHCKQQFELWDGKPVPVKLAAVDFIDDKEGKPIAIQKFIGHRPMAAFGKLRR